MNTKPLSALALASALLLGTAACSSEPVQAATSEESAVTPTSEVSPVPEASESSPSAADQVDGAAAEPSPTASVPDVLAFGDTAIYSDVSVTIGVPEAYEPSKSAAGNDLANNVQLQVTINNTGSGLFDPAGFYVTATSGGQPTSQVFDVGIESAPTTKILPGQSVSWPMVLSVADPAAIVVEAQVDFEHESAVYTNVPL